MKYLILTLRPKQWVKNLFIFVPFIFGKKLFLLDLNLKIGIAFILFCIAASVVYIVNDVMDIKKDRLHPVKRFRPIASGKINTKNALIIASILCTLSILFSFILNVYFGWVVIIYLLFNLLYTKIFKEEVIIDVFCIGIFFLLRIIAGGVVVGIMPSHWLIFMTVLLALFLGFIKRRQELTLLEEKATEHRKVLTKYDDYFIDQMIAVITSSIAVAYMLYTVDARTISEFGTRHLMYTIPFVYYGIFRYLYLVHKCGEGEDPSQILLSDRKMLLNLILWINTCIAVIYFGV